MPNNKLDHYFLTIWPVSCWSNRISPKISTFISKVKDTPDCQKLWNSTRDIYSAIITAHLAHSDRIPSCISNGVNSKELHLISVFTSTKKHVTSGVLYNIIFIHTYVILERSRLRLLARVSSFSAPKAS